MAAYAALVSLMNNIEQIQSHTRLPIHFDKNQSESLLEKVNFLIDFLESYNYHAAGEEIKDLENRITDAAYAAEDIIETHVVDTIHAYSRSSNEENEIVAHLTTTAQTKKNPTFSCLSMKCLGLFGLYKKNPTLSCLPGFKEVMEEMDFIKDEVMKMDKKNPITYPPSLSSFPIGNNNTVGLDDELKQITKQLLARQPSRQVISIVGMGGVGKTTLAKTAYEKPFIVKHFDFCAWVSISQEYDLKKILLGLLHSESSQMSGNELGSKLHKTLYGRRYLVVLDDMWSVEAWDMVKLFLPDNNNGSRIIVTTRESYVTTHLDSCSLKMNLLDEHISWDLFCAKVFVQECCPLELEEVGRKIVRNCKGLPLSIVVIGGLLAKSERNKEYWEYIAQDTKAIISLEDDERCMKILYSSYQNLPVHLKPCFLYIGIFLEDKEIRASMLIKLWVAEGFLKSNSFKELEVLGEEYLNDLISRNLILVHRRGFNGKVKSCMIHDLLRDICLKEAQDDKFMYVPKMCSHDKIQCIGTQRRISLHRNVSNVEYISQVLNTIKSGSMGRTLICDDFSKFLPLQNFRLLRVFNGSDKYVFVRATYSLNDIFQLVNARFIAMKIFNGSTTLLSSVRLLWNLQILIVKGISDGAIAPLEIWEMTEFRHFQFEWKLYLPDPPISQQMNMQGDVVMKKLHTLKHIKDFRFSGEAVKRIPNIKKLSISYGHTGKELEEKCLKNLGLLKNLESLTLSFELRTGSDLLSYLTFPNSLKKLSFSGCGLHWEDMPMIGSLPNLQVLKLYRKAFIGPKWVLDDEGFICLKFLIIHCEDLVQWIAEDTHFPCLEHLQMSGLKKLVEIPSGIGYLPTLQKIELSYCSYSAVVSAKKILDEQENLDNVGLQVVVFCDKDPELESLASDNFLVKAF